MSTILKALERLEKEKQGGAPGMAEANEIAVVRPGVPQEPRRRWTWIAGGTGALALTALLALWLQPPDVVPPELAAPSAPTRPAEPAPQAVVPAPPPAEPAPQADVPASPPAEPVPLAPPAPLAAEPAGEAQPPPAVVAPVVEPAPPPEPPPPPPAEPVPVVPVAATPARAPEPVPISAPEPSPEALKPASHPPAPRAVEHRSPKPPPPAVAARATDPKPAVERTIWHPDPARRRAFVRREGGGAAAEVREGDVLGEVSVRRIEPSGVVFVFDGRELRRAVGAPP